MPFPALHNRTLRLLIISVSTAGALATIIGSATLSYRQAREEALLALEGKTETWAEAAGSLIQRSRAGLGALDLATKGTSSPATAEALRRFVGASPLYRSALLIDSGQITCTYVNVVYPSIPASPEYLELGLPGAIKLVRVPSNGRALDELVINYNAGANHSYSLIIASPGLGELMRYGDRKSDIMVYLTSAEGSVFERSVNAVSHFQMPRDRLEPGRAETPFALTFTRAIPGYPYFVTAVLPKDALLKIWARNIPLYGALAVALAACFLVAAWVASAQTRSLESELREAARLNQVVAHYQPILNLQTGHCAGVEVLMRWSHPERGLIPPLSFIPEAERTGVITQLTECLMVKAMRELEPLLNERPDFHAAINIPVQTLTNPAFPAHVDRLIQRRFNYKQICFELTESTSLNDAALVQLAAMKDLGVRLAVDDFGTGYSNLRYLSVFPFDFLKIDKAFVDGISPDSKGTGFVDQIVSIGRACGLGLIAEGIEHGEQAEYLKKLGVEFGQGFFFAAPMPISALEAWLKTNAKL